MINAVLWDLDGTVLDSRPGVFASATYALNTLKLPVPPDEELIEFLGPPIDIGFSKVCSVPQEAVEEAIRLYREYYTGGGMLEAVIYDGIADVIQLLRAKGIDSYITTSKPQVYANRILKHFGIDMLFTGIYGAELNGDRAHKAEVLRYCMQQHSLSREETVLIGDRRFDVLGAREVGIPCIGILYGYGSREELSIAGATAIAATPADVLSALNID